MSAIKHATMALAITLLLGQSAAEAAAPVGTAFTYQGQLKEGGIPVNGEFDLQFRLFDASSGGNQIGSMVQETDLTITNGTFTKRLDFGAGAFNGDGRWLQISVARAFTGNYTVLSPRQALTAAPYAVYASKIPDSLMNWAASGNHIYNTNTANVGIGTTSPGRKLQIGATTTPDSEGMIRLASRSGTQGSNRIWDIGVPETDADTTGPGYSFVIDDTSLGTDPEFMVKYGSGNVGIGTVTPTAKLHVEGGSGIGIYGVGHSAGVRGKATGAGGYGGVFLGPGEFGDGSALLVMGDSLLSFVQVAGGTDTAPASGGYLVLGNPSGANISMDNNEIMARNNGQVATLTLNANGGNVIIAPGAATRVSVLEITGADLAEKFPMSERVEPGMVVAIDPKSPGKLCMARGAYNRSVAGVASGAGDVPVGVILGNLPGSEDAVPVAMSGRVMVLGDATQRGIEVGDLLTTSDRAGYAMAVTEFDRAHGAVIGKAMTSLARGETGSVLVLVNLH